jgi:hypothetical protein
MLRLKPPLESGTDTEIDLIEREMEGGVVVLQPIEIHEESADDKLGGLVEVDAEIDVRRLKG